MENDSNLRCILKLSGEALMDNETHKIFSKEKMGEIVSLIKVLVSKNIKLGIVCGAGNIFRGRIAEENGIPYEDGDYMGMVGTIINLKALDSILKKEGINSSLYSALEVEDVAKKYNIDEAKKDYENHKVVLFAGGVGKVRHTTDSCAALRAIEMEANLILAGKNGVDGVYTKDPNKYKDAKFIKELTYKEALNNNIQVMDKEAMEMLKDTNIITRVFLGDSYSNFIKIIDGDTSIGTIIKGDK